MSVDLTSTYLGLTLRNPVVASPGPVTGDPDQWRRLDDAGVGAIVLPSLFEEEIESESWWVSDLLDEGRDTVAEASDYLPEFEDYSIGPDRFLDLVTRAKETVSVPVIASLNGTTTGGWVKYAGRLVDAGADAIELNVYDVITDPRVTGLEVEERVLDLVRSVRAEVAIPVAVKIGPWFSALANMAMQARRCRRRRPRAVQPALPARHRPRDPLGAAAADAQRPGERAPVGGVDRDPLRAGADVAGRQRGSGLRRRRREADPGRVPTPP